MNASTQASLLQAVENQPNTPFRDKKKPLWMIGMGVPVIAMGALAGYQFGPKRSKLFFAGFGPILAHGIIPALDKLIGDDKQNPPDDAIKALEADPYYARIVKLFIPLQYAANIYGGYLASRKGTPLHHQVLMGSLIGLVNGIGVNTAHELSHKPEKLNHYLSHLALAPTGYNHFRVEHPYGHHRRVATPEDPASSQMGETFWQFWPRTVVGSFKSAIEIETKRLARQGKKFWSKDNELIHGWAMSAGFHAGMLALFGKRVIPFLATQAAYGITLFELINYVEHYGLKREDLGNGKYARTMPEHSWNNNNVVTNLFLYQLQRHSDHHAYPTRSFQALRHFEEAPQLPGGYASMLLPAMIPAWWFKLMDKRVYDHYQGDLSKASIYESSRSRVYAKFGYVPEQVEQTVTDSTEKTDS
jgi:alkane 1-monooxygenase